MGHQGENFPDFRGAGQTIWVYTDSSVAEEAYKILKEKFLSTAVDEGLVRVGNDDPTSKVTNILAECMEGWDPTFGSIQRCQAHMQYGRYVIGINMLIDERVTTKADWDKMFQLVQDRLVERVGQE